MKSLVNKILERIALVAAIFVIYLIYEPYRFIKKRFRKTEDQDHLDGRIR